MLLLAALRKSFADQVGKSNLFFCAALKFWANYAEKVTRRDVFNVLLTILLLEKRSDLLYNRIDAC